MKSNTYIDPVERAELAEAQLAQAYADLIGAAIGFEALAMQSDSPLREDLLKSARMIRKQADAKKASKPLLNKLDALGKAAEKVVAIAVLLQCPCTVKERDSGHKVGCPMPEFTNAILALDGAIKQ